MSALGFSAPIDPPRADCARKTLIMTHKNDLSILGQQPYWTLDPIGTESQKMPGMLVGYARTSTIDQVAGLEAQERDLKAAGCERIYSEQVSSVAERAKLTECLAFLREADALMVTKPDRLARSTMDLLSIHADLDRRGIGLVIQSMGLDTRNGSNPTSKLVLTILAGVATWEREIMLERQREGIAKAKAEGKYRGRKPTARALNDDVRRLHTEGVGPSEIARRLRIGRTSVYRALGGPP